MTNAKYTAPIELTINNLVALTGINRTSLKSIFNLMQELGHDFEMDKQGKRVFTERELHVLKKIKQLKSKSKLSYENALTALYEQSGNKKATSKAEENKRDILEKRLRQLEELITIREKNVIKTLEEIQKQNEFILRFQVKELEEIKEELRKFS